MRVPASNAVGRTVHGDGAGEAPEWPEIDDHEVVSRARAKAAKSFAGRLDEGLVAGPMGEERRVPANRGDAVDGLRIGGGQMPPGQLLKARERSDVFEVHANPMPGRHRVERAIA